MITDVWEDVLEFESFYQISNFGRLRSKSRIVANGQDNKSERLVIGRIIKTQNNGKGYLQYYVSIHRKRIMRYAHRLVAYYFLPNPNHYTEINHKDGNKSNNNVSNLEWCSKSQNMVHAINTGLKVSQKGEEVARAKLNNESVLQIRKLASEKMLHKDIAKKFNISIGYIWHLVNKTKWKHI